MLVLIYQDYIHNNGIVYRRLCETFGRAHVGYCDAADILGGALHHADILVMPGGADLYNCEKLNGTGNQIIRTFVENGGGYLGICAGAYYACAALDWGRDTDQKISGPRALALYGGTAIGPINTLIENNSINKSWKNITALTVNGITENTVYEGGPIFTEGYGEQVIARYENLPEKPAAVIQCSVGQGIVILSSSHIEYAAGDAERVLYKHRNPSYDYEQEHLKKTLPETSIMWETVISKFKKQPLKNKDAA